ncbi:hypothetical protein ACO0LM_28655, partial [Undibacterium sp. Di26W]|uniref:hypothetical protein n=1 Tax=Undibacterium sp. Di26W TaxID=3413035 RepID=UPI003BF2D04A
GIDCTLTSGLLLRQMPLAPMEFADDSPICYASFRALGSYRVFAVSVLPVCHHLFLTTATC